MKHKPTYEQLKIIRFINGTCQVTAGPGCAKTTTLAMRAQYLVERGIVPGQIAIATYSKALVNDINAALTKLLGEKIASQISVKTLHSFGLSFIQSYQKSQGEHEYNVLSAGMADHIYQQLANTHNLSLKQVKQGFACLVANKSMKQLDGTQKKRCEKAYREYCNQKELKNVIDFNDMLIRSRKLLSLNKLEPPFKHLMIDELQDISAIEREFILACEPYLNSLVLVGDPLQSIYGWRGAGREHWDKLLKKLKPKTFWLTQSFRVPDTCMKLCHYVGVQIDSEFALRSKHTGPPPRLIVSVDQHAQYQWLVRRLKKAQGNGVSFNDVTILCRTRRELHQLALALRANGIPVYESYRTEEDCHLEHLWALIQLTILQQACDKKRIKQLNREQIGQAQAWIDRLWLGASLKKTLKDRIRQKPSKLLSVKSDHRCYSMVNGMDKAIRKATQLKCIESAIQCLIDACGKTIERRNQTQKPFLMSDLATIKTRIRQQNLQTLDVIPFALFQRDREAEKPHKRILLQTIHHSKGGEWPYVIVLNVVDGVFPRANTQNIVEELSLFFVAITRTSRQLYLLQTPTPPMQQARKENRRARRGLCLRDQCSPFLGKPKRLGIKIAKSKT
ncbi:UvrD-helicase domain-containing protein [Methylomonas sp. HYX-M1]|uniref:UvrD-helicase domain-containing protein n=1 Tax=Methylomonas sp. HYX-M1 TaxID=3139307 RepID=UPI00345B5A2A